MCKTKKYTTIFIIIFSIGILYFTTHPLLAANVKKLSNYISDYRVKRDAAKQLERSLDPKSITNDSQYFQAKKEHLTSMTSLMIAYLREVRDKSSGSNPDSKIKDNSAYKQINDQISSLKSTQNDISNSNNTNDLKNITRNLKSTWHNLKISIPDDTCVILNQRLSTISDNLQSTLDNTSSNVSQLKKRNKDTARVEFLITNKYDELSKINQKIQSNNFSCSFNGNLTKMRNQLSLLESVRQLLETTANDIAEILSEIDKLSSQKTKSK